MIRVFLGLQALLFVSYGLYCLINPSALAGAAGVAAITPTGVVELRTMYGGLQLAVGVVCTIACLAGRLERLSMGVLLVFFAGLAPARGISALVAGDFSPYTIYATLFETFSLLVAAFYFSRHPTPDSQ
jgi:Domain of unknown function (DUF4345)